VILNGCECEPYLTRDNRFMLERTDDLMKGLKLIMKALDVKKGRIGVEDNKPRAIEILKKAAEKYPDIEIDAVKTKYPQGAEKMLIKSAIGRFVPPGKLPMDIGVVIQNIGTALAIYDAVVFGVPAITAAMTVSGKGIVEPKNLIVRVGTTIGEIIEFCGGITEDAQKLIVGGPMMGVAQYDLTASVQKATSGILVLTPDEIERAEETNCVRCGNCIQVCPINLMPTYLLKLTQTKRLDELKDFGIWNCIECGSCQYNCPANIPLVQWFRLGKFISRKYDESTKTA
jgi:electron transport complex protein RnfC